MKKLSGLQDEIDSLKKEKSKLSEKLDSLESDFKKEYKKIRVQISAGGGDAKELEKKSEKIVAAWQKVRKEFGGKESVISEKISRLVQENKKKETEAREKILTTKVRSPGGEVQLRTLQKTDPTRYKKEYQRLIQKVAFRGMSKKVAFLKKAILMNPHIRNILKNYHNLQNLMWEYDPSYMEKHAPEIVRSAKLLQKLTLAELSPSKDVTESLAPTLMEVKSFAERVVWALTRNDTRALRDLTNGRSLQASMLEDPATLKKRLFLLKKILRKVEMEIPSPTPLEEWEMKKKMGRTLYFYKLEGKFKVWILQEGARPTLMGFGYTDEQGKEHLSSRGESRDISVFLKKVWRWMKRWSEDQIVYLEEVLKKKTEPVVVPEKRFEMGLRWEKAINTLKRFRWYVLPQDTLGALTKYQVKLPSLNQPGEPYILTVLFDNSKQQFVSFGYTTVDGKSVQVDNKASAPTLNKYREHIIRWFRETLKDKIKSFPMTEKRSHEEVLTQPHLPSFQTHRQQGSDISKYMLSQMELYAKRMGFKTHGTKGSGGTFILYFGNAMIVIFDEEGDMKFFLEDEHARRHEVSRYKTDFSAGKWRDFIKDVFRHQH